MNAGRDAIMIHADSKEDALSKIEKMVASAGLDMTDHRTYSIGTKGEYREEQLRKWGDGTRYVESDGTHIYRVDIETRKGGDRQRSFRW